MNFKAFKASEPARGIFAGLGLVNTLKAAASWEDLRARIVAYNGCDAGRFVEAVRRADGVSSSGERVLLHAICFAADFAWLADELMSGRVWQRMDDVSGEHRAAVAACVAGQN